MSSVPTDRATAKNDFVNIYNPTNAQVDLTGWQLEFALGGTHTIGSFTLDPGYTFLAAGPTWTGSFDEMMGSSPKNTDELRLKNPGGTVIDEVHIGPNPDELPILARRAVSQLLKALWLHRHRRLAGRLRAPIPLNSPNSLDGGLRLLVGSSRGRFRR